MAKIKTYTNHEIRTIIEGTSARSKARLFLRDRAGALPEGCGRILRGGEPEQLLASVPDYERLEFNRIVTWGFRIEAGLLDLYETMANYRGARGQLVELQRNAANVERAATLVNRILSETTPPLREGAGTRRSLLESCLEPDTFELATWEITPDGFLRVHTTEEEAGTDCKLNRTVRYIQAAADLFRETYDRHERDLLELIEQGERVPTVPEYQQLLEDYRRNIDTAASLKSPRDFTGETLASYPAAQEALRLELGALDTVAGDPDGEDLNGKNARPQEALDEEEPDTWEPEIYEDIDPYEGLLNDEDEEDNNTSR